MKKKLVAVALTVIMLFALVIPALAMPYEEGPDPGQFNRGVSYSAHSSYEGVRYNIIGDNETEEDMDLSDYYVKASEGASEGKVYKSFCVSPELVRLSGGYTEQPPNWGEGQKAQVVAALNYIENKYGSIGRWNNPQEKDEREKDVFLRRNTKIISQIVIWTLLGHYEENSVIITDSEGSDWFWEAVKEVLENYKNTKGNIGIVYLTLPDDDIHQPQIVPIRKPELGLFKSFTWSGDATGIPAGRTFKFVLEASSDGEEPLVAATGSYITDGSETQGGNHYVHLDIKDGFIFDEEMTYVLREDIPTPLPASWVYSSSTFNVGYREETRDGVLYRELYYHEDVTIIEEGAKFGPRFVNSYSYTTTTREDPDPGSLTIRKAFSGVGVTRIPSDWTATFTVTGPRGYSRTFSYSQLPVTLSDLDPGTYTVTEANPSAIPGYIFVTANGMGDYSVSRGSTTLATITNVYNDEEVPPPPPPPPPPPEDEVNFDERTPLAPPEEFDDDIPLSDMPQTGDADMMSLWFFALCMSLLAIGASIRALKRTRESKEIFQ